MSAEIVKLVPFTEEELQDIQFTAVDKMIELNRNLKTNKVARGTVDATRKEIERLGKVVEKCSNYCSKKRA